MNLLTVNQNKKTVSAETVAEVARIDQIFHDCRTVQGTRGEFLFGDFGIVDAFFLPVISRIRTYGLTLKQPASLEYYNMMIDSPLFKFWVREAERNLP